MTTYFLSGLGADKRVFDKLNLPGDLKIVHIEWISPLGNESLTNYAKRLLTQIDTTKPFQLVGLSFGGIVATELSKIIKPERVILISSVSTCLQLPWYYKLSESTSLHRLLPSKLLKSANAITYWLFGATSQEDKTLLKQILNDTDGVYLKWAISKITTWDNKAKPENLYHIHGTADNILPIRFVQANHIIEGGGHLMVYNRHEGISKLLEEILS